MMIAALQSVLYDILPVSSQLDRHAVELLRTSYFFPLLTILLICTYLYRCRAQLPAKTRYVDPTHQGWLGSMLDIGKNKHRIIDRLVDINKHFGEDKSFGWATPQVCVHDRWMHLS